ncbi:MAG: class I SAM-dependent methyltransferase family protein [Candidatus Bathyarchaeia archaeon]
MSSDLSKSLVKSYCVRVEKSLGEKTIRILADLNLLDRSLKVARDDYHLFIPIKEKPSEWQLEVIEKEVSGSDVCIHSFQRYTKPAKSILDILEDRLPPHLLACLPRSIDFIGNIAILEIPEELEDYKMFIGEAVMSVFRRVRSVLAKSSVVAGVYRVRRYEVVAGSENTETIHREYGCSYLLDPRKVYFSPRLSYEHYRVASQVVEGESIVDMFAGVGPFSILIAKLHRNVIVYAIDINPDAIGYLEKNIRINKVEGRVVPILGDAREIIQTKLRSIADRIIMNLPEKAIEYIDAACIALKPSGGMIHYYEFEGGSYALEKAKARVIEAIVKAGRIVDGVSSSRVVREVAPYRWQIAVDVKADGYIR